MTLRLARHLVWVLLLLGAVPGALGADADDWGLSEVRDYDYWWFRTPPHLIAPREVERLAASLDLTDPQQSALEALVLSAERAFEDDWLELAESFDDLRWGAETRQDRDWRARRRRMRQIHHQSDTQLDAARAAIRSDLQLILTDVQASSWDHAMRDHLRRTTLAEYANLNGETVDLLAVTELIEGLTDAQRGAIDAELETYAIELDTALSARRAARTNLERACRKLDDSRMSETQASKEELQGLTNDVIRQALRTWDASRRIRDINDRYATLVGDMLGETERQRLKELTADAPLPGGEYQGQSRGLRMLRFAANLDDVGDAARTQGRYETSRWTLSMAEAAQGVEPLTQDQREHIAQLTETYEAEYSRLRRQHDIPDLRDSNENAIQVRCDEGRVEMQRKKRVDSRSSGQDWTAYRQDLGKLDEETVEKLRALLTVRQRILLQTRE